MVELRRTFAYARGVWLSSVALGMFWDGVVTDAEGTMGSGSFVDGWGDGDEAIAVRVLRGWEMRVIARRRHDAPSASKLLLLSARGTN